MATKPTTKPDIRFIVDVTPKTDSSFGRSLNLTVTPVIIEDGGKVRNLSYSNWDDNQGGEYDGLRVEGHIYDRDSDKDFYFGTDLISFDIYRVDARRAESLVKTFRRLEKRFAAQDAKWGRATDAAGILSRIADAVGCKESSCFGRSVGKAGWSYDDNEYRWMEVDSLRDYLSSQIKEWKGDE